MNYYKRHLGDYAKDTRHLSLAEHGAFCLLLDYYYATERPIPDDRCERIANAYADAERQAVRNVLREFFVETPDGWRNSKADAVIGEAQAKSLKAKESADSRWHREQCERNANASKTHSDGNASHKPLATNHKEERAPAKKAKASRLADWVAALEGADAVPADDPLFDWAKAAGIPRHWIALAWWAFEARYESDAKTYADWRAVFRRAVREDWLRLWRKGRDGWELTTAGENVRCEMEAAP